MVENSADNFKQHLLLKDLADKTMDVYFMFYKLFPHEENLEQSLVNKFLVRYKSNVAHAFVSTYLQFLGRNDIVLVKKTGRKKKRVVKILTMNEVNILAKSFYESNKKYGLMFELLFKLALRREEITTMKVSWFAWDRWAEDLNKPCRIGVIGKNNKERTLIVSPFLMNKVKDFVQEGIDERTLSMDSSMFGMGNHRFWEIFVQHSQKALGKRCKPHQIRHTCATLWEQQGVSIPEIQRRLGHKSIQTTQIYLNIDNEKMLKSWEKEFT